MNSTSTGFRRSSRNLILPNKTNIKDILHTQQYSNHHHQQFSCQPVEMHLKKVTSVNNLGKLELSCQKDPNQKQNKIVSLLDCGKNQRKSIELLNYGINLQNNINNCFSVNLQNQQARNVYERYHNNKNIIVQKQRVSMSDRFFKNLLEDYHIKIYNLGEENRKLVDLKDRFQSYLVSLNLTQVWKNFYGEQTENAESPLRNEKHIAAKNSLKILNLEKKNQTLNFIIKQYRKGNQQQIKNLQKKINEYRPNIQRELAQKLEEVNRRLKNTESELEYFKKEFKTNCPSFTWDQTILKNRQYIAMYEQIKQENSNLKKQIGQIIKENQKIIDKQMNQQLLLKEIQRLKQTVTNLQQKMHQLQNHNEKQNQRIEILQQIQQQFNFNCEKYKKIQEQIYRKDETIRQSSIKIAKLQSQNLILNQKLISLVDSEHKKIFLQEKLRKRLEQMFIEVNQLKRRAEQSLFESHLDMKEKKYFLSHLLQKICHNYDEIVGQYQQQLMLYEKQAQSWNNSMKKIALQEQFKRNIFQSGKQQLEQIRAKHSRCLESMKYIDNNTQCKSCRSWMTHWGQIDNLYLSAVVLLQKLTTSGNNKNYHI